MTYYLLSPCKTTAGFMSTLKKKVRLDLREAATVLREGGYNVLDAGPLLVVEKVVEVTLYRNGKMVAKTDDRDLADKSVEEIYSLILPEDGDDG
ncbi:MAG: hypothetical protein ACE5QF_01950 [Thermoplasmata archaeon]